MKSRKHLIIIGTIFVFGAGLLSVGNGCSKSMTSAINMSSTAPGGSSANGGSGTTVPDTPAAPVIPDAKTVSLVYSKQVVDQLSSCVGVAKVSDKTIAMYDQKKGAISVYGSANTVTSPMMMAVASIAGEICNDLIDQEVSSGARMFVGFDMNSTKLPSNSAIADSVTRLSLSCWQRNETLAEMQVLQDMINQSVADGEFMATRKTALLVCTSMLSSLDSLLN